MAIQGFFTGDVKIKNLNGVLKAVDGVVEVATDAGTVTSVGIQVGSTGTDVNVANSPVTTSGNITLNLPTASATNRGLLSSADWAIFDAKQGSITLTTTGNNGSATLTSGTLNIPTYTLAGLGGISLTSLSASSPLAYNNTTGAFSIQVANGSQNGYLSSGDWTTFNSKQSALTFSSPLVNTSGTISIPAATSSVNGYLTSTDWVTFNSKQGAITLTTTGSSGAATLIGTTLNIPNYSGALTGYVPYTGATGNVDLGEYGISSGYFQADLTPSGSLQVGRMQWNSTDGTMDLRLMGNNVTLQIGQEQVARVVNGTGGNLLEANYQAVKIIGAQGQRLQVGLARADNDANSKDTLGLVTENINNNQEGFVTVSGLVNEINTTGSLQGETWADGDTLYLSGTTSGAITNVKPSAPIHTVIVGFVVYAHANHGKIFVKIDNGYELEELHDVAPTPYVNNGVLYRDTATNLWKSATIGTLLGYTPANAATTLTINGTAYDLSINRTWNVGTVTSVGTSGPLTGGTITGSGTIGITQATTSSDGYLSSTDWNTFNNKQAAGSYITALTGEATASGPGSASVTLSTSAVTGKLLTGLNLTGGGSIAATDSILQAFGKVQNQISGLAGGVTYQGVWNASTNTPTLTSSVGTKGYYYIVDVAGSTNLNGITDWKVGDWAIFNGSTWDKVDNTDAVSSVNGFTGAVSLTTSNIAEGTNLYYLDSRARLALSFTAGSGAYDNTTGVITIPTNTSQLTNGANFITLSSLSASSPLSYNNVSGAFSIQVANGSQNGYLSSSDWTTFNSKQAALTLTTTGSSGSSTLVGATLNVPTYTLSGLGGVPTSRTLTINGTSYDLSSDRTWSVGTITGTGTSNYLPKWQSSSALGDSLVYDASTAILIGTTTASTAKFMVYSATADNHYQAIGSAPSFRFADTITSPTYTGIIGLATASNHFIVGAAAGDMVLANNTTSSLGNFLFGTGATERMRITPDGSVLINTTSSGGYKFNVNGTVYFGSTSYTSGIATFGSSMGNGLRVYGGSGSSQWDIYLNNANLRISQNSGSGLFAVDTAATFGGSVTATSIIRSGGTSSQYLMADGSVSTLTNPVTGTGTTNYLPKFTGTSTIGNSQIFDNGTNVSINVGIFSGALLYLKSIGATAATYGFYVANSASTATFYVNDAGNGYFGSGVGIGTNPSSTYGLDVNGATRITGNLTATAFIKSGGTSSQYLMADGSVSTLTNPVTGTGTTNYLPKFTGASTIGNSSIIDNGTSVNIGSGYKQLTISYPSTFATKLGIGDSNFYIQTDASPETFTFFNTTGTGDFIFKNGVSSTTRLTLNGSGNLGLGVTPSAWNLGTAMQFAAGSLWSLSTTDFNVMSNTFYGSGFKYVNSTGALRYFQDASTSSHQWFTAPSGTAGNAISFTQAMTLNASGNLSIGNTNDTYKLDVSGTGRFGGDVTVGGSGNPTLTITGSAGAYTSLFYMNAAGGGGSKIFANGGTNTLYLGTNNVERLTIASTGAATFSANVTSNGFFYTPSNATTGALSGFVNQYAANASSRSWKITNDVSYYGDWALQQSTTQTGSTFSNILYFSPTGAATFSSTLRANSEIYTYTGSNFGYWGVDNGNSYVYLGTNSSGFGLSLQTAGTERMRITSGGVVLINNTSTGSYGSALKVATIGGSNIFELNQTGTGSSYFAIFTNGNGAIGTITTDGTSTSYNTTSDYRLKTDYKDFSGLDLVSKIKAYDYEWKSDKSRSYGVIAHELQSVINYAVTGVKDGKEMQGVDYSKIVPVLIKAVQESHDIIKELKEKVEILESK